MKKTLIFYPPPQYNMNPNLPSLYSTIIDETRVWNLNKRCKVTTLPPGVFSYPSLPSRKRLGIWTSLSVPSCTICIWASSFWASLSVIRTATAPAFSALIVLVTKEQSLQKHTSFIDKSYIVLSMQLQLRPLWIFLLFFKVTVCFYFSKSTIFPFWNWFYRSLIKANWNAQKKDHINTMVHIFWCQGPTHYEMH